MRFGIIQDAAAILVTRGVYKQADLYERCGGIYAKVFGGYVRLYWGGKTSVPAIRWEDHDVDPDHIIRDSLGRMKYDPG